MKLLVVLVGALLPLMAPVATTAADIRVIPGGHRIFPRPDESCPYHWGSAIWEPATTRYSRCKIKGYRGFACTRLSSDDRNTALRNVAFP